jgi:Circularly permutated YpsA SLOG family
MSGKHGQIKIISGGQTGVDRSALDFAIQYGFEHRGWCPRGCLAEDGVVPLKYKLRETESAEYDERTEKNVVDSDATLIVAREKKLSGGTAFTKELAAQHGRPVMVIYESEGAAKGAVALSKFLQRNKVRTLNVAGPRESQAPGLGKFVRELLEAALVVNRPLKSQQRT